jgi:hypothetical protein
MRSVTYKSLSLIEKSRVHDLWNYCMFISKDTIGAPEQGLLNLNKTIFKQQNYTTSKCVYPLQKNTMTINDNKPTNLPTHPLNSPTSPK